MAVTLKQKSDIATFSVEIINLKDIPPRSFGWREGGKYLPLRNLILAKLNKLSPSKQGIEVGTDYTKLPPEEARLEVKRVTAFLAKFLKQEAPGFGREYHKDTGMFYIYRKAK